MLKIQFKELSYTICLWRILLQNIPLYIIERFLADGLKSDDATWPGSVPIGLLTRPFNCTVFCKEWETELA
jgi:hypothetical protein